MSRQKTLVIGAGPVGALAALYAAGRGHDVEIYELRSDLREPSTVPLNFTKSINLALSERGLNALSHSGRPALLERVLGETIPMRGRMIHGQSSPGEFHEQPQEYDVHGRTLLAIDRGGLNKVLLDELEALPNVRFFFNHKLTGADFRGHKAWFEVNKKHTSETSADSRHQEIEASFDFLIGADGAHSAARFHLMKFARMDYQQVYIDTLWCEFTIKAKEIQPNDDPESRYRISPNYLHIWPGNEFMFIAIPSLDGSFTCTLFLPSGHFASLEADPQSLPAFFDSNFPGVTTLISTDDLISSFSKNAHLPLISIKCKPHYFGDSAVIVGDAAHAMVPFYGQGMNAGLEDVRVLFSFLDEQIMSDTPTTKLSAAQRSAALDSYSAQRSADAHAINDLALDNYHEMRSSVNSRTYKARKWLEEMINIWFPNLGWQTKYSRVSFSNERYIEVVKRSRKQGRLLLIGIAGLTSIPVTVSVLALLHRWRRSSGATKSLLRW